MYYISDIKNLIFLRTKAQCHQFLRAIGWPLGSCIHVDAGPFIGTGWLIVDRNYDTEMRAPRKDCAAFRRLSFDRYDAHPVLTKAGADVLCAMDVYHTIVEAYKSVLTSLIKLS